jgi:hypothetical protein
MWPGVVSLENVLCPGFPDAVNIASAKVGLGSGDIFRTRTRRCHLLPFNITTGRLAKAQVLGLGNE